MPCGIEKNSHIKTAEQTEPERLGDILPWVLRRLGVEQAAIAPHPAPASRTHLRSRRFSDRGATAMARSGG